MSNYGVSNPNFASAEQLIENMANLLGQSKFVELYQHYKNNAPEEVREFYDILEKYKSIEDDFSSKESDRNARLIELTREISDFFKKNYGVENFNLTSTSWRSDLDNPRLAQAMYFHSAMLLKFRVNAQGILQPRITREERVATEAHFNILQDRLESMEYLPAYRFSGVLIGDDEKKKALYVKGANLGSILCKAKLGQFWLSHIAGTLQQENPPVFEYPAGWDQAKILEGLNEARRKGDVYAVSMIGNFCANFFSSAPALYQFGLTTDSQKERLREWGGFVKSLSGDHKVNEFVDKILGLSELDPSKQLEQAKSIRDEASRYLGENYSQQFFTVPEESNLEEESLLHEHVDSDETSEESDGPTYGGKKSFYEGERLHELPEAEEKEGLKSTTIQAPAQIKRKHRLEDETKRQITMLRGMGDNFENKFNKLHRGVYDEKQRGEALDAWLILNSTVKTIERTLRENKKAPGRSLANELKRMNHKLKRSEFLTLDEHAKENSTLMGNKEEILKSIPSRTATNADSLSDVLSKDNRGFFQRFRQAMARFSTRSSASIPQSSVKTEIQDDSPRKDKPKHS